MIRVSSITVPPDHTTDTIIQKCADRLHVKPTEIRLERIVRRSIDARKKPDVHYVYTVDIRTVQEARMIQKGAKLSVGAVPEEVYRFPKSGTETMKERPVVIGSGPCGLFCTYMLARNGYRPLLLERGAPVEEREADVRRFWETGLLLPESNVQFGEGGAGTFSDGKLNTMVKDNAFRNRKVLEIFAECGAPKEILYLAKPHIGTDILRSVVRTMRTRIEQMGAEVRFHSCLTDLRIRNGQVEAIECNGTEWIPAQTVVLALGHSARDTFELLYRRGLSMRAKSFAMGVRMEHPQEMINESQYGAGYSPRLPAADYKLTAQTSSGRGVYSFCMCPGGYVVNASSEPGRLAVNGMSNHARDSRNANSALIVTVTPEDFRKELSVPEALAGMACQRRLEELAYRAGEGAVPVQLWQDFMRGQKTSAPGEVQPCIMGAYRTANLRSVLPDYLCEPLVEAMDVFGRKIKGFDRPDAVLSGIESRTSSPVRIERDEHFESNIAGIYPCGEGAGYAGGITSAAMDGIKAAEQIAMRYAPAGSVPIQEWRKE